MSSILPYDIIVQIIDTVGEDKNTELLKELSLVSHSFHHICCKRLFATVAIHNPHPRLKDRGLFSKKSFVNLLKSRPDVAKYIRKLTYEVNEYDDNDHLFSPILPNFLRTISHLNCLTIDGSCLDWHAMDSSLTSAFLYLMHLPTINHIDLSCITDFPLSSLTPSVNLLRLGMDCVNPLEEEVVQSFWSEMMPKIHEFRTIRSPLLTTKLLHAEKQDGQPAFNFKDLRQLSICLGDKQSIRYLLQNAMSLEKLHLILIAAHQTFEGLHDILSASAGTLKVLDLTIRLAKPPDVTIGRRRQNLLFERLCEELEAMAGHNMPESLSLEVIIRHDSPDVIGSLLQNVEKVLVKPGWSALRQVSFKVSVICRSMKYNTCAMFVEELQSLLPDKYLNRLSKLDFVALRHPSHVAECYCTGQ